MSDINRANMKVDKDHGYNKPHTYQGNNMINNYKLFKVFKLISRSWKLFFQLF